MSKRDFRPQKAVMIFDPPEKMLKKEETASKLLSVTGQPDQIVQLRYRIA